MNAPRKIIQIAAARDFERHKVFALCDDGTLWSWRPNGRDDWDRLPPIPQEPTLPPVAHLSHARRAA